MTDRPHPTIRTTRLVLRRFDGDDFSALAALAVSRRIADAMISVPHPYSVEDAKQNVARYQLEWANGSAVSLAIALPDDAHGLIGYIAVKHIDREHNEGELSFWIADTAAGRGYVTEAAHAVFEYAFDELGLNRICAYHVVRNPGSGRVLQKIGMVQEGRLRQRVNKRGVYEDVLLWAALRQDRRMCVERDQTRRPGTWPARTCGRCDGAPIPSAAGSSWIAAAGETGAGAARSAAARTSRDGTTRACGARRPVDQPDAIRGMLRNADLELTARLGPTLVGIARAITTTVTARTSRTSPWTRHTSAPASAASCSGGRTRPLARTRT